MKTLWAIKINLSANEPISVHNVKATIDGIYMKVYGFDVTSPSSPVLVKTSHELSIVSELQGNEY